MKTPGPVAGFRNPGWRGPLRDNPVYRVATRRLASARARRGAEGGYPPCFYAPPPLAGLDPLTAKFVLLCGLPEFRLDSLELLNQAAQQIGVTCLGLVSEEPLNALDKPSILKL